MNVRTIVMGGFLSHGLSRVDLPDKGLVLVTGPNGAGKSSMVEAVAFGLWGKTLRGTPPWTAGVAGTLNVEADGVSVVRSVGSKGTGKFEWNLLGELPTVWETNSKAQVALSAVVGEQEVWRRTHVFSSQDAANFSGASDGERKHLLETVLGIDQFDRAYDDARADLRVADMKRDSAVAAESAALVALAAARRARTNLGTWQQPPPSIPKAPLDAEPTQEQLAASTNLFNAKVTELQNGERAERELRAAHRTGERTYDQLAATLAAERRTRLKPVLVAVEDVCNECGQALPDIAKKQQAAQRAQLSVELTELERQVELAAQELQKTAVPLDAWLERKGDLYAEVQRLRDEQADHRARLAEWASYQYQCQQRSRDLEAWSDARERFYEQVEVAEADIQTHDAAASLAAAAAKRALQEFDELTVVSAVLGLRGVRAHVLGRALEGIEEVANVWLAKLSTGAALSMSLRSYVSKPGSVADAISLEVQGAGGGRGYRAASGGERRRIDAALLLALAEVSAAAYGKEPGTIFLDEVFDALDAEGVDAVVDALAELSGTRCVVLITHSEALVRSVPAALHLQVNAGVITAV